MTMLRFGFVALALLSSTAAQAALHLNSAKGSGNFIYDRDPKALSSNVMLVFKNGSINDPKGKEGLTRFAFQALLRGTKGKSRQEFISGLERLGAAMEVDAGVNRTILGLNALSDNLEAAIQMLAEAVLRPGLRAEEIKVLQDEEIARLSQRQSNNRELMKRIFLQALYHGTPLAFPPDGTISGVQQCGLEDIRATLASAIKSGNLLVAVTSNRPESEVKAWLEKAFASIPEGNGPALPEFVLRKPVGRTLYVLNRKGSSTTEVALGQLGIKADDKDREALETGMFVFGSDFTSRVPTVLRKQNGWTYGATASYQILDLPRRHGGAFALYSFPQAEFTEKLVPKAVELYEDYVRNGINETELKFAKNSLENSYPFHFAEAKVRVLERVYQARDGAPLLSVPAYRKKISALSPQEILRAIRRVHDPKNIILVVVGDPERTKNLSKLVPGIAKTVTVDDPMKEF